MSLKESVFLFWLQSTWGAVRQEMLRTTGLSLHQLLWKRGCRGHSPCPSSLPKLYSAARAPYPGSSILGPLANCAPCCIPTPSFHSPSLSVTMWSQVILGGRQLSSPSHSSNRERWGSKRSGRLSLCFLQGLPCSCPNAPGESLMFCSVASPSSTPANSTPGKLIMAVS